MTDSKKILFVCLGNICRSPALMSELRRQAEKRGLGSKVIVDSCAMTSWNIGEPPDHRMRKAALARGLTLEHTARLLRKEDFKAFDLILAVDREVLQLLERSAAHAEVTAQIALATAFSKAFKNEDMLDPYYDAEHAFDRTMVMAEDCCVGILDHFFSAR